MGESARWGDNRRSTPYTRTAEWITEVNRLLTTFIPTRQGWLYLAIVIELYSRQVLGWAMGERNNAQLVQNALTMAVWKRGKAGSVIVHSDQGRVKGVGDN